MEKEFIEHRQEWRDYPRHLIVNEFGSVQVELYKEPQWFGGTAFIYGLWVNPEHRRQGHATQLLARAEEVVRADGHSSVYPKSGSDIAGIHKWYQRQGYTAEADYTRLMKKELHEQYPI